MATNPNLAAMKRYQTRLLFAMVIYVSTLLFGISLNNEGMLSRELKIVFALLPGLSIAWVFVIVGLLLKEVKDEFLRMLMVRQTLIGAALAFAAATIHGFLSVYDLVPKVDAYWWSTLFFAGLFVGMISNRISYGTWGGCK